MASRRFCDHFFPRSANCSANSCRRSHRWESFSNRVAIDISDVDVSTANFPFNELRNDVSLIQRIRGSNETSLNEHAVFKDPSTIGARLSMTRRHQELSLHGEGLTNVLKTVRGLPSLSLHPWQCWVDRFMVTEAFGHRCRSICPDDSLPPLRPSRPVGRRLRLLYMARTYTRNSLSSTWIAG